MTVTALAIINAIFAWASSITLFWAAHHVSGRLRKAMYAEAGLAMLYSVSYWWLVFNLESGREWSETMRWVGIISWPIAWALSPVLLVAWLRIKGRELEQEAKDRISRINSEFLP